MPDQRRTAIVVGGGAIGLYVAHLLANHDFAVRVIEAGDAHERTDIRQLGPVEHEGVRAGWASGLGGTTRRWGGQLWPWAEDEFVGWESPHDHKQPLDYSWMCANYQAVFERLKLPSAHGRVHFANALGGQIAAPPGMEIRFSTWLGWRQRNFGRTLGRRLRRASITLENNVRVESLTRDANLHVNGVLCVDSRGLSQAFQSDVVILAAGTIENCRLLLRDPGCAHLPIGQDFSDHVSARVAEFELVDIHRFAKTWGYRFVGGVMCSPRIVLNRTTAQELGAARGFAHWEVVPPPGSALPRLRDRLRRLQRGERLSAQDLALAWPGFCSGVRSLLWRALRNRRSIADGAAIYLRVDLEQTVPGQCLKMDVHGSMGIDWNIEDATITSASKFRDDLLKHLDTSDSGLKLIKSYELDVSSFTDTFHMMGGTRRDTAEREGVVSGSGLVHDNPGLYVCGASTFVTGGIANPTLTALALSNAILLDLV